MNAECSALHSERGRVRQEEILAHGCFLCCDRGTSLSVVGFYLGVR